MKIKNIRKILAAVVVAFFIGLSVTSSIHATTIKNVKNYLLNKTYTKIQTSSYENYIPHDPIYISGDDDFTPENGVTGGSGTKDDPYIIEGWEIDASKARSRSPPNNPAGIYIEYTRAYLVIRNCRIYDGVNKRLNPAYGIGLNFVKNVVVENCSLENNHNGISFYYITNTAISNCTFLSNEYGIELLGFCKYNKIKNCNFSDNENGVDLSLHSNFNIVSNCNFNSGKFGLSLFGGCKHNEIRNCRFYDIKEAALSIIESSSNLIENCEAYDTKGGLMITMGIKNEVKNCVFKRNSMCGISIAASAENLISHCNIDDNGQGLILMMSFNNHITNCNLRNNSMGVFAIAHGPGNHINYNNIEENHNGVVKVETLIRLDATNNWWGSADGPSGEGSGEGDTVDWEIGAGINFSPWLTEPNPDAGPQ